MMHVSEMVMNIACMELIVISVGGIFYRMLSTHEEKLSIQ